MLNSKRSNRFRGSEAANGLAMVSPTALYAILMLAAPLVTIVAYSFMTDGYLKIEWDFTFANYIEAWTKPQYRQVMFRSLGVSLAVTLATVLLAFPIAYYVSFFVNPSRKSLWLFLITIPFWTSYLIRVFLWKVILGFNGVVNSGLMGLGIIDEPLTFILYSMNSVVITLAHAYAPFAILPIFVALEKIDRSYLEAGRDLGETPFVTFVRVTLPLAMPGVISAVMIVFIPTIGDYVTPHLLGGPGGQMVANLVQLQYMKLDNYPVGSALAVSSMFMVGLVLVMAGIGLHIFKATMKRLTGSVAMPLGILASLAMALVMTAVVIAFFVLTGNAILTVGFAIVIHVLAWAAMWMKGAKA